MPKRIPDDIWRQFQQELSALEQKPAGPLTQEELARLTPEQRQTLAKTEFQALKRKYGLKLDDVLVFLPEEEVVAYLQGLMS